MHRAFGGSGRAHQAAIGAHDVQMRLDAFLAQPVLDARQIALA